MRSVGRDGPGHGAGANAAADRQPSPNDADQPPPVGDDTADDFAFDDRPVDDDADRAAPDPGDAERIAVEAGPALEHGADGIGPSVHDARDAGTRALKRAAMRTRTFAAAAGVIVLIASASCTAVSPNAPTYGAASIEANAAPRGSPGFCRRYASQTYTNSFETNW